MRAGIRLIEVCTWIHYITSMKFIKSQLTIVIIFMVTSPVIYLNNAIRETLRSI